MKRTNYFGQFFAGNRRLLLLLLFLFAGTLAGVFLYLSSGEGLSRKIPDLFLVHRVTGGLKGALSQLISSEFQTLCLLLLLFIGGLSVCGTPLSFAVPVFWGIGLGMTEAFYYSSGLNGFLLVAVLVLPHSLIEATALLMGCSESLRMSLQFSGQLLPKSAHCGGLWQEFRLYLLRFPVFLLVLLASGAVDVLMRLVFARFFPAALVA